MEIVSKADRASPQASVVHYKATTGNLRPVHLLRVSLLRVLEANFPRDSL